jgi:hypothetical protein
MQKIFMKRSLCEDLGVSALSWEDLLVILEGVCAERRLDYNNNNDNVAMNSKEEWYVWLTGWFRLLHEKLVNIRDTFGVKVSSSSASSSSSKDSRTQLMPERLIEKIRKLQIFPLLSSHGNEDELNLGSLQDGNIYMASKELEVNYVCLQDNNLPIIYCFTYLYLSFLVFVNFHTSMVINIQISTSVNIYRCFKTSCVFWI